MPQAWLWLFERTSFQTGFAAVVGLTAVFVGASSLVYRRPPGTARDSNPVGPGWVRRRLSDRHFLSTAVGFPLVFTWFYVPLHTSSTSSPRTVSGWALPPPVSVLSAVSASSPESRVGTSAIASASSRHFSRAPDSLACAPSYFRSFTRPCWPTLRSSVSGSRSGHSPRLVADHSHCVWTGERDRDGRPLLNVSTAGFALVAPTGASVLHRVTGGWVVPLVALGIVTILGQASSTAGLARPECNGQPTIHI